MKKRGVVIPKDTSPENLHRVLSHVIPEPVIKKFLELVHEDLIIPGARISTEASGVQKGDWILIYIVREITPDLMVFNNPIVPRKQTLDFNAANEDLQPKYTEWRTYNDVRHRLDGPAIIYHNNDPVPFEMNYIEGVLVLNQEEYDSHPEVEQYRRLTRSSDQGEGVDL